MNSHQVGSEIRVGIEKKIKQLNLTITKKRLDSKNIKRGEEKRCHVGTINPPPTLKPLTSAAPPPVAHDLNVVDDEGECTPYS